MCFGAKKISQPIPGFTKINSDWAIQQMYVIAVVRTSVLLNDSEFQCSHFPVRVGRKTAISKKLVKKDLQCCQGNTLPVPLSDRDGKYRMSWPDTLIEAHFWLHDLILWPHPKTTRRSTVHQVTVDPIPSSFGQRKL